MYTSKYICALHFGKQNRDTQKDTIFLGSTFTSNWICFELALTFH